jgi:hypothetical protein
MDVQAPPQLTASVRRAHAALIGMTFAAVALVAFAFAMLWLILVELPLFFR